MSEIPTSEKPWKRAAWHTATMPSGLECELRIPGLTDLIRNEAVPERLRAIAVKSAAHPAGLRGVVADELKGSRERGNEDGTKGESDAQVLEKDSRIRQAIEDVAEMQVHLIADGNVRIGGELLRREDVTDPDFPAMDAEWLGAVMLRETSYDAKGVRLGVEPLDAWERFRHFHNCGPDCEHCAALQDEASTADLVRL